VITVERVFIPSVEKANLLNALAESDITCVTCDRLATFYADCIRSDPSGKGWDVGEVNKAIIGKLSISGLAYIKEKACKQLQRKGGEA
jgi:hypothetical protein